MGPTSYVAIIFNSIQYCSSAMRLQQKKSQPRLPYYAGGEPTAILLCIREVSPHPWWCSVSVLCKFEQHAEYVYSLQTALNSCHVPLSTKLCILMETTILSVFVRISKKWTGKNMLSSLTKNLIFKESIFNDFIFVQYHSQQTVYVRASFRC